jgi:uncharacterized protein
MRNIVIVLGSLFLAAIAAWSYSHRSELVGALPVSMRDTLRGLRHGFRVQRGLYMRTPDGVRLAVDVYLPRDADGPLGTVLVRLPYGKERYGDSVIAGEYFSARGFAVVVQDMRGKHGSEGEFTPSKDDRADGAATLDWIVRQPWSNGKVGTFGCSALGESQLMLAAARHPAHAAIVAEGAGGANGTVDNRYSYFGLYEGGIFNLASGFGWFLSSGSKLRGQPEPPPTDHASALRELPTLGMVARHRRDPTDFDSFVSTPLSDPYWRSLGYLAETDQFATPALNVNSRPSRTL